VHCRGVQVFEQIQKGVPIQKRLTTSIPYAHRRTRQVAGKGLSHPGLKIFRVNSVFRTSASCSKFLNDKKYFNPVKNFRANSVIRTSASCSKYLNNKKYFKTVKIFRTTLFFSARASCSKILNDKNMQSVSEFKAHSAFQVKRKLLKNPECKKYIQYSEKFQANIICSKILNDKNISIQ